MNSRRIEEVVCEDCGKLTPEDRIYVCSSCGGEFCRNCMADVRTDTICKDCEVYVGKYSKHLKDEW